MRRARGRIEDATDDKLQALQQGCECPPDLKGNTKGQPETGQRGSSNLFQYQCSQYLSRSISDNYVEKSEVHCNSSRNEG